MGHTLEKRLKSKIITFHKARLNLIEINMEHLTFKKRTTRLGGGELAYNRPNSAIDGHLFSFFPSAIKIWNHLPVTLKSCEDIEMFSNAIKEISLSKIKN